jgi:predicted nucleic acid-binding Zn ribbon protein
MRKLNDMLGKALGRDEVLRTARAQRVLRRWPEIVGPMMAKRSRPDRYEKGTVWVAVQGSAWAQELRMVKERLIARLKELSGDPSLFRDMRFGVRPIEDDDEEPTPEIVQAARDELEGLSIREIADRRLKNWPDAPRD